MIAQRKDRAGFTAVEVLVVVIVVGVIGMLGYTFFSRMNNRAATETSQSRVAEGVKTAPEIKRTGDLDKASTVLDQTDPAASGGDLDQLDGALSSF